MKVSEAIEIQKGFVARKYHIYWYDNGKLKESMKTLTKAYETLWMYLEENYPDILDDYLINLECYKNERRIKRDTRKNSEI